MVLFIEILDPAGAKTTLIIIGMMMLDVAVGMSTTAS
jgi:hypothetical protein